MKLKNCPFCDSKPTITEHMPKIHGKPQWQIGCEEDFCLISPGRYGFGSKEQAIKAWNTRADTEDDAQLNARKEKIFGLYAILDTKTPRRRDDDGIF